MALVDFLFCMNIHCKPAGHFDDFDGALAPFIPTVTADRFKPSHFWGSPA